MAKKLKTKTEEIRKLSDDDLAKELEDVHRRLFSLRLQSETRQLPNHREPPKVKRLIARLKTIQRERLMAAREGR
ncbi:MAG: 50S ribosomal protein L29 [Dehalococcoidia bacterium]|jgi:large subunit ribosomal protein L29